MNNTKIIFVILIICFSSCLNYAQYKNQLSVKQNSALIDTTKKAEKLTEKEPALAGFLSFIAPGLALGQLYNGEQGKFLVHSIIGVTSLTTLIISSQYVHFDINPGGGNTGEDKKDSKTAGALVFFSAIIFTGNYIISVADAVVSSNNINKKVRLQKYRSESNDRIKLGFSLDQNKNLKLEFALGL